MLAMNVFKVFYKAVFGLIFGVSVVFLACIAALALAGGTGWTVEIPFFIRAWPAAVGNGVEFLPYAAGMMIVILVSVVVSASSALRFR